MLRLRYAEPEQAAAAAEHSFSGRSSLSSEIYASAIVMQILSVCVHSISNTEKTKNSMKDRRIWLYFGDRKNRRRLCRQKVRESLGAPSLNQILTLPYFWEIIKIGANRIFAVKQNILLVGCTHTSATSTHTLSQCQLWHSFLTQIQLNPPRDTFPLTSASPPSTSFFPSFALSPPTHIQFFHLFFPPLVIIIICLTFLCVF